MNVLLQHVIQNSLLAPGITLVVGVGNGADLPALRQIGSRRLVLAEAHPQQADELARRVRPDLDEEAWSLAITPNVASRAALQVMNNPRFSSLKVPKAFLEYAPNLRIVSQVDVPTLSLSEAIENLAPRRDQNHVLILDAPGQIYELISATPSAALQRFTWILLYGGAIPQLYVDDSAIEETAAWLGAIGFDPITEDPDALYPHMGLLLARNDHRVSILRNESQIADLSAQLERAEENAVTLTFAHNTQIQLAAERQTQLEQAQKSAAEYRHQLEVLTADQALLIIDKTNLANQLEHARKTHLDQAHQISALMAEQAELVKVKADLTCALGQAQKSAAEYRHQLEALTDDKVALAQANADLTSKLDQAQKSTAAHKKQLDEVEKQRVDQQQLIQKLESENSEMAHRQRVMQEELVKAEAQIELIKDLLLREPGL